METAVIFGGAGFIGRRVAARLVASGRHVIVPTRRREAVKGDLIVLPNTDVVACDPFEPRSLTKLLQRADVAFNLAGILHETGRESFETVHVENVRRLTDTVTNGDVGLRRFVHVSALNAATGAPSRYLRSKGKGEAFVKRLGGCEWTVIRPSVVFGDGDSFLNLFGTLLRRLPLLALPMPGARFQPIWVDDLAAMAVACLDDHASFNTVLSAGGPEVHDLREIVGLIARLRGPRRPVWPLPGMLAWPLAKVMEFMPLLPPTLTTDTLASMGLPSVCEQSANDALALAGPGLTGIRDYLAAGASRRTPTATYSEFRTIARRG